MVLGRSKPDPGADAVISMGSQEWSQIKFKVLGKSLNLFEPVSFWEKEDN